MSNERDERKPRTVTTESELDALAVGTVILDVDGDAWQRVEGGWNCTVHALNSYEQASHNIAVILGPLTVILEPTP